MHLVQSGIGNLGLSVDGRSSVIAAQSVFTSFAHR